MSSYEERVRRALIKQHQLFFDYDKQTLKTEYAEYIDCPVCGSSRRSAFLEKDWFHFVRCADCSMVYTNPRLNESATYLFYNSEWTYAYNEEKFFADNDAGSVADEDTIADLRSIEGLIGNGNRGRLLEIGPGGRGTFLRSARARGFDVYGVELGEDNYATLHKTFGDKIFNKDLRDVQFDRGMFSVVYMRDVFEHVLDPKGLLREVNRIVEPDGIVCVSVPNIDGLIYRLVKQRHTVMFGFAHVNYWSPATLGAVFETTGFHAAKMEHKSLDMTITWLAEYLLGPGTFTSVSLKRDSFTRKALRRVILAGMARRPLQYVERALPKLADALGRGSVITAFGRKDQ